MSKFVRILLGLCLVVVVAAGSLWGTRELMSSVEDEDGPSGPRSVRVALATPETREIESFVTGVGTLRAIRVVELRPASAGRVTEVNVSSGSDVAEGDILVQLDDRPQRAALAEAEATLTEAEQEFIRFDALSDSNAAAEARVEETQANLRRAEAAIMSAQAALEDRNVTAPFDGKIGFIDIEPGSFLSPETAIAKVFDLSSVELQVSLPERYFGNITPGQTVSVTTSAYAGVTFEGEVEARKLEIDLATRSFDVRAQIANGDDRLVSGMFANARVVLGTYEALLVPDDAIISEGLSSFVYTVTDGTANRTEITPGTSVGALTEVREGLQLSDRVVVAGWDNLSDGTTVEIDEKFEKDALN